MSKHESNRDLWLWFGSPLHFICGDSCRFHLGTLLPNGFVVSTVGAYFPPSDKKNVYRGIDEGDEIGFGRKFETMVFRKIGTEECGCPEIDGHELDMCGYNDHMSANAGHMAMCEKWAVRESSDEEE